jgi:hypothetical protein
MKTNSACSLRITYLKRDEFLPGFTTLNWTAQQTRFYGIQYNAAVDSPAAWVEAATVGFGGNSLTLDVRFPNEFAASAPFVRSHRERCTQRSTSSKNVVIAIHDRVSAAAL